MHVRVCQALPQPCDTGRTTHLVRHDAYARWILVDQDVIRALMWTFGKYIFALVVLVGAIRWKVDRNGKEPRDDRFNEPRWQRCI